MATVMTHHFINLVRLWLIGLIVLAPLAAAPGAVLCVHADGATRVESPNEHADCAADHTVPLARPAADGVSLTNTGCRDLPFDGPRPMPEFTRHGSAAAMAAAHAVALPATLQIVASPGTAVRQHCRADSARPPNLPLAALGSVVLQN